MRNIQNDNRKGTSKRYRNAIVKKMLLKLDESLQATDTENIPPNPEDNTAVSQASYAKIASSNLPNDATTHLSHQEENPQVSGSAFQFSEVVEEISLRLENLHFQKSFITFAVWTYDKKLPTSRKNLDQSFRKAPGSNKHGNGLALDGLGENLRKHEGIITSAQKGESSSEKQNFLYSSGKTEQSVVASECFVSDQRMKEIASRISATNHINGVQTTNSQISYYRYNPPPMTDGSLQHRQICPEVHCSNNNDISIRIFAHIAFLNQIVLKPPPFYSKTDIEKIVEYAWKGIRDNVLNKTQFQIIDIENLRQILNKCSQFDKENIDLFQLVSYSAAICQIGVRAIHFQVKNVPYYVTTYLRNKIKEVENVRHGCFECHIEKYSDKIAESLGINAKCGIL